MTEKKIVIDALRLNYDGMFNVEELFKEVDKWAKENEYLREVKKKLQHVEQHGKKIDYIFELWHEIDEDAHSVVRLRVLIRDMVDFTLERGSDFRNMQKGRVLIIIDGILETDIRKRWQMKPWYVFVRTIVDKTFWRFWVNRYDGYVSAGSYGLFKRLQALVKKYKY